MAEYGVSRATVRQALAGLVAEGLLEIRRGLGTYVTAPRFEHTIGGFYSFSREIERHGLQPGTKVLDLRTQPAGDDVAEPLGIEPGTAVVALRRLRLAGPGPAGRRDQPSAGGPVPGPRERRLLRGPAVRHADQRVRLPPDAGPRDVRADPADRRRGGPPRPAPRRAGAARRARRVRPGRRTDRVLPEHGPRRPLSLLGRASRPMTAFDDLLTWRESSTSGEAIAAALDAADRAPDASARAPSRPPSGS